MYKEIYSATSSTGPERCTAVTTCLLWGVIEPSASIIAACLPTHGHLFRTTQDMLSKLRSFISLRSSTGSKDPSKGSPSNDTPVSSHADFSNYLNVSLGRRPWYHFGLSQNGSSDMELGDTHFNDKAPLNGEPGMLKIHVSQDLTQQERPTSSNNGTSGKPAGFSEMYYFSLNVIRSRRKTYVTMNIMKFLRKRRYSRSRYRNKTVRLRFQDLQHPCMYSST